MRIFEDEVGSVGKSDEMDRKSQQRVVLSKSANRGEFAPYPRKRGSKPGGDLQVIEELRCRSVE